MLCVCKQILTKLCVHLDTQWPVGLVAIFSLRVRERFRVQLPDRPYEFFITDIDLKIKRFSQLCFVTLCSPTVIEEILQEQIFERRKPHLNAWPTVFHFKGGNSHDLFTFLKILQPHSHLSAREV